jgi:hypothetical protein
LGAGLGAWVSSMIGISVPNSQLDKFQEAIQDGQLLMIIDVPKSRVDAVTDIIKRHHPEAQVGGTEPTFHPYVD